MSGQLLSEESGDIDWGDLDMPLKAEGTPAEEQREEADIDFGSIEVLDLSEIVLEDGGVMCEEEEEAHHSASSECML